jgi:hypothetical protein
VTSPDHSQPAKSLTFQRFALLAKHKVAGSTPVARSPEKPWIFQGFFFSVLLLQVREYVFA